MDGPTAYVLMRNLAEILLAWLAFSLLLFVPGFVFGWLSGLMRFRRRSPGSQLLLAHVFSLSLCPLLTYLVGRWGSFRLIWLCYGTVGATFVGLLARCREARESLGGMFARSRRRYLWVVGLWGVIVTVSLIDIRTPAGLYRSLTTYDYVKHTGVVDAITRTALPPVNPSFHPGRNLPLCYYYFWHLMCSLVDRAGGSWISARSAVQAGTIWAGLSLFAILWLYLRFFAGVPETPRRHFQVLPMLLLTVTGLDLLPAATMALIYHKPLRTIEWWNEQISAWVNIMIWVPQHLAALVACLTAFLVLRTHLSEGRGRMTPVVFAGLALSSALAMSVWVALVACATIAGWIAYCGLQRWGKEALAHTAVGLVFLAVSLPFLLDLQAAKHSNGLPIAFNIRQLSLVELLANRCQFTSLWPRRFLRLASLPLNYLLELGFFLLAAAAYWRQRLRETTPLPVGERFLLMMTLASILVCSFFRSSVSSNDLGWRGFMFAQFCLLLWSIPIVSALLPFPGRLGTGDFRSRFPLTKPVKAVLLGALFLGVCGSAYDLVMMRLCCLGPTGTTSLELARTYEWVREHTTAEQIIQHNPTQYHESYHGLYGNRQIVVADEEHGTLFGVDKALFKRVRADLEPIFAPGCSRREALAISRRYDIAVLIFGPDDAIWGDTHAWIWKEPPAYRNSVARVYLLDRLTCAD
jgi:hypothetical protein